ncbi:M36 family metallopeptidase [Aureisphaera sp.]
MRHSKQLCLILSLFICSIFNLFGQNHLQLLVKQHIEQNATKFNLNKNDVKEWRISSHHVSKQSGVHHIYGIQQYNGLDIYQATFSLHLANNDSQVVVYHNNFHPGLKNKIKNTSLIPGISATEALQLAIQNLNLKTDATISVVKTVSNSELVLEANEVSSLPIQAKLVYYPNIKNDYELVWDLTIDDFKGNHLWNAKIDAVTGKLVDKKDIILSCSFHDHALKETIVYGPREEVKNTFTSITADNVYQVYAMPIESPHFGDRTIVIGPEDENASQQGWTTLNNVPTNQTKGNNVHAYEDRLGENMGSSAQCTSEGFIFPLDTNYENGGNSTPAAITNLFYWTNLCHDVWYHYGFDEASGNFQHVNFTQQGDGNDSLLAEAQDAIDAPPIYSGGNINRCTASYLPTNDGLSPRIQMNICGERDSSLDNLVIAHEYGHGISTRLVGGSDDYSAFNSSLEQMGEGWSDWFGLMMTMKTADLGTDNRTVGTWFNGDAPNGNGERNYPYSTDMTESPYTYNYISQAPFPGYQHHVGSVWASMLWELTWELIDAYGFDPDLYNGTGGNNIAMKLVIEGLKYTNTSLGFVDARNGILTAAELLEGGKYVCNVWRAFAKRGLGYSASQGSHNSLTDGNEAFDVPECMSACDGVNISIINETEFPLCEDVDYYGFFPWFEVEVEINVPPSYTFDDLANDYANNNMTLDIIDKTNENTIRTINSYEMNYESFENGIFKFSFPIRTSHFLSSGFEGNYDFRANVNLTTEDGTICSDMDREFGISLDNCPVYTCTSNYITIESEIPDCSDLDSPLSFDVCGTFVVRGNYEANHIDLVLQDVADPSNNFTITDNNPQLTGDIVFGFPGGFVGEFCFTVNEEDFSILEGNYEITAMLFTTIENEFCREVKSQTLNFSFDGCSRKRSRNSTDVWIEGDKILSWKGTAWKLQNDDGLELDKSRVDLVTVFPNPATSQITVSASNSKLRAIEIYDVYGKHIETVERLGNYTQSIRINEYATGLYIFKIILEDNSTVMKNVVLK